MEESERIVACALLTREDVVQLGSSLKRVYPISPDSSFDELLNRLDAVSARSSSKGE